MKTPRPFAVVAVLLAGVIAATLMPIASATQPELTAYRVSGINLRYVHDFAALTNIDEQRRVRDIEVQLGVIDDEYVAPADGVDVVTRRLGDIGFEQPEWLHSSAINAIAAQLQANLSEHYASNFFVAVDPRDIDMQTGRDLRRGAQPPLWFRVEYTGPTYQVNQFVIQYAFDDMEDHPRVTDLNDVQVDLVATEQGYAAWRPGATPVRLTLAELNERGTERYTAAGVQQVLVALRDHFTDRQFMAVRVSPSQRELDQSANEPMDIPLLVVTGVVSELRTLAAGERIPSEDRINNPAHTRILERSPVQRGDMIQRDILDDYIFHLGRHPGRRVDVGLSPAEEDLTIALDYLVSENRPLMVYGQLSNTGTKQVGRLRSRFGLFHNQLTGNDDILNIDYNTSDFDDSHTVLGSYEARFFDFDRIRWRLNAMWSEFDASEVGLADLRFNGESWSIGAEIAANVYQDRQLFVDLVGGARYLDVSVSNFFENFEVTSGSESFFLPYVGARMERVTEKSTTFASVVFEFNFGSVTDLDVNGLNRLGRLFPDEDWVVLRWDGYHSFYLEPLLNPEGFRDVTTPSSSTLAHELVVGFKGQYAFENRLVPQVQMVAGGMYSVRGYPESIAAADTVLLGTLEYRFHLPRAMRLQEEPGQLFGRPFRWAPQQVYGSADWDLILRGFVDAGRTINADRLAFENDETLIGAGVGLEFLFRRNVNLRVDWGFALKGIQDEVDSGSNRVHFAATLLY